MGNGLILRTSMTTKCIHLWGNCCLRSAGPYIQITLHSNLNHQIKTRWRLTTEARHFVLKIFPQLGLHKHGHR
jgi:hypothetical protein